MKFLLAQPVEVSCLGRNVSPSKTAIAVKIAPVDTACEESQAFFEIFRNKILEDTACTFDSYMKYLQARHNLMLSVEWRKDTEALHFRLEGSVLKGLKKIFGENIQLQFAIKEARAYDGNVGEMIIRPRPQSEIVFSKEMTIITSIDQECVCDDEDVELPKPWTLFVHDLDKPASAAYLQLFATIEIRICFKDFTFSTPSARVRPISQAEIMKKMLEEKIETDLTIIAMNKAKVKCHKSFLSVQSPVFAAMFRNDCKEKSTSKIDMLDMSEELVNAFLAYLYYGDLTEAHENSVIAFELLEAAHKYEIPSLEENVKRSILQKSNDWFNVDIALRIFSVYGKVEGFEDLKAKSVQVMKSKRKELEESEDYRKLFETDPKAAMELFKAFSP